MSATDSHAIDRYFLYDPVSERVRFTQTGKAALERRFARLGLPLARIQTLAQLKRAIATVTMCEYRQLTPAQRNDATRTDAIHDLSFITDHVDGLPLEPLPERRRQMREAEAVLLASIRLPDQSC